MKLTSVSILAPPGEVSDAPTQPVRACGGGMMDRRVRT